MRSYLLLLFSHAVMSESLWPPWTAAHQAWLLFTVSQRLLKLMLIKLRMLQSHPLSFIVPIFAWNVPLVILISFKRSLAFPMLLFSSISLHCFLRRLPYFSLPFFGALHSVGCIFPFFLCLLLLFFSQLFVMSPQTTILPSCISFPWGWFWSPPPVQCYEPPSIVLWALCLSDLIPWIYLSLPLYNHKEFNLGHTWMTSCFSQLSSI